jgi:DNA-directed RNA polymerase subunit RPC12/RpoP
MDQRVREEELKSDMGVLKFDREPFAIVCQPCGCRVIDKPMEEVFKRYN